MTSSRPPRCPASAWQHAQYRIQESDPTPGNRSRPELRSPASIEWTKLG
jgi:hypothetical protein